MTKWVLISVDWVPHPMDLFRESNFQFQRPNLHIKDPNNDINGIFHTFHHVFIRFALSQYKMQQCEVLHVADAHFCHDIHTTSSQKSTSPSTTSHNGTIYLVAKVCENVT